MINKAAINKLIEEKISTSVNRDVSSNSNDITRLDNEKMTIYKSSEINYSGDPNDTGSPDILNNAEIGSFYIDEQNDVSYIKISNDLWKIIQTSEIINTGQDTLVNIFKTIDFNPTDISTDSITEIEISQWNANILSDYGIRLNFISQDNEIFDVQSIKNIIVENPSIILDIQFDISNMLKCVIQIDNSEFVLNSGFVINFTIVGPNGEYLGIIEA